MIYMLLKGFCMIWEIYQGGFNTFTKVRRQGQYPGRLLGVRQGGTRPIFWDETKNEKLDL